jgi:hypothetical protein
MSEAPADRPAADLSERDAALLDFEASWWEASGAKEAEIRERFGLSAPRYYQILNQLLDDPAALAHAPLLVKRLRRLRSRRQEGRSARQLPVQVTV